MNTTVVSMQQKIVSLFVGYFHR